MQQDLKKLNIEMGDDKKMFLDDLKSPHKTYRSIKTEVISVSMSEPGETAAVKAQVYAKSFQWTA